LGLAFGADGLPRGESQLHVCRRQPEAASGGS
jgi:hypothetical protein